MDTVTYPDPRTIEFVSRYFIALRVSTSVAGPLPGQFHVQYTPTIVVVDEDGKEHHRVVGFLQPEEFIPSMSLGIGKSLFNRGQCGRAVDIFDRILSECPGSQFRQQAEDLRNACLRKGKPI